MPENLGPERFLLGPEKYAPPHHRPTDAGVKLAKQQPEAPPDTTSATMIRRIAMDSMTEIGRVIRELENISEMLRNESERVSREVSGLASLNEEAAAAKKVIAESLKQWKE